MEKILQGLIRAQLTPQLLPFSLLLRSLPAHKAHKRIRELILFGTSSSLLNLLGRARSSEAQWGTATKPPFMPGTALWMNPCPGGSIPIATLFSTQPRHKPVPRAMGAGQWSHQAVSLHPILPSPPGLEGWWEESEAPSCPGREQHPKATQEVGNKQKLSTNTAPRSAH